MLLKVDFSKLHQCVKNMQAEELIVDFTLEDNVFLGQRVNHPQRLELGIGEITKYLPDGKCSVIFDKATFSGIHKSILIFIDGDPETEDENKHQ